MDDDNRSHPPPEDVRFRPVTNWELRSIELATQLRASNKALREAEEALALKKDDHEQVERRGKDLEELREKHREELAVQEQMLRQEMASRLEMQRRQHMQEVGFHMDRQRQQYALDTAAHMDVQRQRHEAEMGNRLEMLRRELTEHAVAEIAKALQTCSDEWTSRHQTELVAQREADKLTHAAKMVEVVAQLKEADERRRKEKRELAEQFKQRLEEARNAVEAVRKERDDERVEWQGMQREIEGMSQRLEELAEAELKREEECRLKEEAQRELDVVKGQLAEVKKLQGTEASRTSKKLNAKLAKLQKEHTDLVALQKQTATDARDMRVRCGKLEVLKEDSEREVSNGDKRYAELERLHDRSTEAITMAHQEIISLRERLKQQPHQKALLDAAQKEIEVLRDLLRISTDDLKRSVAECESLRMAFSETENGAFFNALHERATAVIAKSQAEVIELRNRLMESPPHRNEQEFLAVRAMLGTANAELEDTRTELKAVRAAYDKTDQGIQLHAAKIEIQKLHGVVAVLITEIKDNKLVEQLMGTMMTEGIPLAAKMAQLHQQSSSKRAKKTVGNKG